MESAWIQVISCILWVLKMQDDSGKKTCNKTENKNAKSQLSTVLAFSHQSSTAYPKPTHTLEGRERD